MDSEDEMDMDSEDEMDMDSDELDIDIEDEDVVEIPDDASMEDVLSVFKKMGPSDRIIVKKEGDKIHLDDEEEDVEYIISTNESITEKMSDSQMDQIMNDIFSEEDEEMDEVVYEISMDEEDTDDEIDEEDMEESMHESKSGMKPIMFSNWKAGKPLGSKAETKESTTTKPKEKEKVETGKDKKRSPFHRPGEKTVPKAKKTETKEGMGKIQPTGKAKGAGMNLSPKKFEYKEGKKHDISAVEKRIAGAFSKGETKEAARTLSNGTRNYGLRKGLPKAKVIPNSAVSEEVQSLRQKNVEYQKALNVFREKLNEVAVFNSNLAYATRLFTEHSTTKKEKINILRRFDSVESLKESKQLYKTVKDELSHTETKNISENVERQLNTSKTSGSATTLIESKTYENPQFLRIKDLMSKL